MVWATFLLNSDSNSSSGNSDSNFSSGTLLNSGGCNRICHDCHMLITQSETVPQPFNTYLKEGSWATLLAMSNKNSDPSNKETGPFKAMSNNETTDCSKTLANEETTDHSKTMAFASCAIACLAALSQGNLLTWLNPVLPQVDFRFDN